MTITENVLASAREGVDAADRVPEVTDAMVAAGRQMYAGKTGSRHLDDFLTRDILVLMFQAMWRAAKQRD